RMRPGGFYSLADDVTERALQSLDQLTGERQFLWVHYYDAHEPYGDTARSGASLPLTEVLQACRTSDPVVPTMIARAQELYRSDVSFLDQALGRLFARLDADGDRWRTHVIVTTDHGESFGEDGSLGHGKRLTKEQLLVPTFFVSPDVPAARRTDVAGSIDIGPTVLSFAKVDGANFGGRDLSAPVKPQQDTAAFGMRRTFLKPLVDFRTDGTMVRESGPRFFAVLDGQLHTGVAGEIYEDDLLERPVNDERSPRLNLLFQAFAAELAGSEMNENIDPETLRALEALGYVR
ncbi:MAG: arylsulfatase A-like enzyme, partial [Pseudohongiellaceae bacterium]